MKRSLLLIALLSVALAACSSDKKTAATAATTTSGPVVTSTTVGAAVSSSTTTPAGTCPDQPPSAGSAPPPAQGAALADGRYFGFISSIAAGGSSITFDVAQLFVGDAATKAAAEDGGESPPPNDYWIRNNSPATRTLNVVADATLCIPTDPAQPTANGKVTRARFTSYAADGEPNAAWIGLRSGDVIRVDAQFFP